MTIGKEDKPGASVRAGNLLLVSYRRSRDARTESGIAYGEHIIPLKSLGGFTGDLRMKRRLLEMEGVHVAN